MSSTSSSILRLHALIKKIESFPQSLSDLHPSKDQYDTLRSLSLRLKKAATDLPTQIEALQTIRRERASTQGIKLIHEAESDRSDLITTTQLKDRIAFVRNIPLFFEGQRDRSLDSHATRARKQLTRERCERICSLSPNGLITWAVAFHASTWTANAMSKSTFDYVVEHIEPDGPMVWPPDIYHLLRGLAAKNPLLGSRRYNEFLKGRSYIQ